MADKPPPPESIALETIERVTFFKRDEVTTDLICCRVEASGLDWTFHEEMDGWAELIGRLERLPGFRRDWFAAVSQPAFEACGTLAYERADAREAAEASATGSGDAAGPAAEDDDDFAPRLMSCRRFD